MWCNLKDAWTYAFSRLVVIYLFIFDVTITRMYSVSAVASFGQGAGGCLGHKRALSNFGVLAQAPFRHLSSPASVSISGRLNKVQLIGRWWQTSQFQFIAVWRQPIHFPSAARPSRFVGALLSPTHMRTFGVSTVWWEVQMSHKKKNGRPEWYLYEMTAGRLALLTASPSGGGGIKGISPCSSPL